MKKRYRQLGQYIFDNHDTEGANEEFLEETAPLIGFIIHSFNSLDEILNSSICELINNRYDEIGSIIICKMNFSSKVDLFERLITSLENSYNKNIQSKNKLIQNLKKCANLRNAVVHAEWENIDEEGYTYVKMKSNKKGIQQEYWQFTVKSLEEIDDFMYQTYMDFDILDEEISKIFNA